MIEKILVLFDELLSSQVAILVEKVDFEDLLAIWGVSICKDIADKEGEDIAESSETNVSGKEVVIVGVEELIFMNSTSNAEIPPA